MRRGTSRLRLALGLSCLVSSVLLLATALNLVPDRRGAILEGRARLCEVVALTSGNAIDENNVRRVESTLRMIVTRQPDVLSAAVRREDGSLLVEVGNHVAEWQKLPADYSIDTHVQVPIFVGSQRWGSIELRFKPVVPLGVAGLLHDPHLRLVSTVSLTSLLLFWVYLTRMLASMDPSSSVPGHVRSALDTLAEGLLVIDKNDRIVLANSAFAKTLGLKPEKIVGGLASKLAWLDIDGRPLGGKAPWILALESKESQTEARLQLEVADRGMRTFNVNCSPVLGTEGEQRGVLVSLDDITQLERQRVELAHSKAAAESANSAKSSFLANMSHEIRTPMNAILGFTDALRRGLAETELDRNRYLSTIHASGEHLLNLINDVLDLSKVESGRFEFEQIECHPHVVVSEVLTVLDVRAKEKGLQLELMVADRIPETVHSDPVRLRQIITNLVGNALKFTSDGGVKVRLSFVGGKNAQMLFEVIDSGVGIPAESLDKIFDPFTQADSSTTRHYGGTGLGLTISKRFAEALGGSIEVTSQLGEGSNFKVLIAVTGTENVRFLDQREVLSILEGRATHTGEVAKSKQLKPCRILVADDGEANRQLLQLVLSRAGATVVAVENGREAIEQVASQLFDVILLDMQMPIMDGYTAARLLRSSGVKTPIIALTANAMIGDEEKCRAAGCSGFLSKPVNIDKLLATLGAEVGFAPVESAPVSPQTVPPSPPLPTKPPANSPAPAAKIPVAEQSVAKSTSHESRVFDAIDRLAGQIDKAGQLEKLRPVEKVSQLEQAKKLEKVDCPQSRKRAPIISTLPLDDPDFFSIVAGFTRKLPLQVKLMREALQKQNFAKVSELAHWLKGAAGTMGFDEFTEPARQLEREAKSGLTHLIAHTLKEIEEMIDVIDVTAPPQPGDVPQTPALTTTPSV